MRKFIAITTTVWQEALNLRARIVVWTSVDIILPLVMSILFKYIYQSPDNLIQGLNYYQLVQYYLLITFLKVLVISHPHENVASGIWKGSMSRYLTKPIPPPLVYLMGEIGWRMIAAILFLPLVIIISLIIKIPLIENLTIIRFTLIILSLSLSFIVYWIYDFIYGIAAFWFTDISGLASLKHVIFILLGGLLVPPQFLPIKIQTINRWLPFQYILAFPIKLAHNQLSLMEIISSFTILVFYGLVFYLLSRLIWKKGLKQYTAVGI